VNLPFREPLVPTGAPLVDAPGREHGAPWTTVVRSRAAGDAAPLAELVRARPRGLVVAGWGAGVDGDTVDAFATAAGWPVLADPVSSCRTGAHAISTYEALLRADAFAGAHRPELVVRVGAPLTSKVANAFLAGVPHAVLDADVSWLDPQRDAERLFVADPSALLAAAAELLGTARRSSEWLRDWCAAESRTRDTSTLCSTTVT
jgi:2-succinyl-5-enolpyruvyl-6-hydroxy-3-cyclohexene-1-carboxylate synthase